jgi:hexosaminidase
MRKTEIKTKLVFLFCTLVGSAACFGQQTETLSIVPWPKSVQMLDGRLILNDGAKIIAHDTELAPLAAVLADEIRMVAGLTLPTASAQNQPGSIILKIDPVCQGESYQLEITDRIIAAGGNYKAVASATTTLLQMIRRDNDGVYLPKAMIHDEPFASFRGLLIDVARRWHSPAVLEQCVELCRLYKISFLQLHLTDDQAFTFPSTAFPKLASPNTDSRRSYTLEELKSLEDYARRRGVAIVPEFEVPGHAIAMCNAMPELFQGKNMPYNTINFAKKEVIDALDVLVGEICEVFQASPYFHIGGDEANLNGMDHVAEFQAAFAEFGLGEKGQRQLYRRFIIQMNDIVKKHGRQMIVWEGFRPDPASQFQIPKDVIVMEYECSIYPPKRLIADGCTIINAAWTPLYVVNNQRWSPGKIYDWNQYRLGHWTPNYALTHWHQLDPTPQVLGAQMCAWEQPQELEIPSLRSRLPAMSERIWNPDAGKTYTDFAARFRQTDRLLDRMIGVMGSFDAKGLIPPPPDKADLNQFDDAMTLSIRPAATDMVFRYTLDGKSVTADSPLYKDPIRITETTTVQAAAFSSLTNTKSMIGLPIADVFYKLPKDPGNLAFNKSVTVSGGTIPPYKSEFAIDGQAIQPFLVEFAESPTTDGYPVECWKAKPWPQWLRIDLGEQCDVSRAAVFFFSDEKRSYQYTLELSPDGQNWTPAVDQSQNTAPAKPAGEQFQFPPQKARYARLTILHCTNDDGFGLIELRILK